MNFILRIWGLLTTIPNRLLSQWSLVLASVIGLVSSISLILSIPLYADSIYYRTLQTNLNDQGDEVTLPRPPFAFLFHYYGGWHGPKEWEDIQDVDHYFSNTAVGSIGLPLEQDVRYISTDSFRIFPTETTIYSEDHSLAWVTFGFMDDLESHIELLEGRFPVPASQSQDDPIEVLIHEELATELGLQVGEQYLAHITSIAHSGNEITTQFPLSISGIWRPTNPLETYWISSPSFYENVLFVPEESFSTRISTFLPDEIFSAYWYLVMDGSGVHVEDVVPLLNNIHNVEKNINYLLPNIRLSVSPADALWEYRVASRSLTILLYAFSIPILGLILAFISLVSRLSVERQRNEIAILRSRGATPIQILGLTALEGLILGIISLAISLPLAIQLTRIMAQTRSFLELGEANSGLRVAISSSSVQIGFAAIGLVLLAMVIPAMGAARHTIISYKQETGRVAKSPWWQRAWVDVFLFIPAAYGTYLLQQQGRIAILDNASSTGVNDPFQNPLLFLVPALAIFALTLFSLRLIHPVMGLISRLAGLTKNTSLTLASRQLARTPGSYHTPLIILILTVSLSSYTASLAYTLDEHLSDQAYYENGADIQFLDTGSTNTTSSGFGQNNSAADEPNVWVFIPVDEYRDIEGVEGVARLGRYAATGISKAENLTNGFYIGVDRVDFPQVAFWRDDFADQSLGSIMNSLAIEQSGVLVDQRLLDQGGYEIGDTLSPVISMYGNNLQVDMKIVGAFDLFPTWYPEQGPLLVGNLDYLFQQMGGEFPYRVLLDVNKGMDPRNVASADTHGIPMRFLSWNTPVDNIDEAKSKPDRQGLLGFLFIGFATAALLTVLAFLLHMVFSFQRRFIELGVLRAAGLSMGQMTGYLVWELAFLIMIGGVVGTILGYLASVTFIPFMQIGREASDLIPPFKVLIAWDSIYQIYWMFGILFALTLMVSILLLRRMRIFQAIKLGETV
ncbi:MAG: FtsX-like permease family protein [Anaerolineales bacterium]